MEMPPQGSSSSAAVRFKVEFGAEVRRFSLPRPVSLSNLFVALHRLLDPFTAFQTIGADASRLLLRYFDGEDWVTMRDDDDLAEALAVCGDAKTGLRLKLAVTQDARPAAAAASDKGKGRVYPDPDPEAEHAQSSSGTGHIGRRPCWRRGRGRECGFWRQFFWPPPPPPGKDSHASESEQQQQEPRHNLPQDEEHPWISWVLDYLQLVASHQRQVPLPEDISAVLSQILTEAFQSPSALQTVMDAGLPMELLLLVISADDARPDHPDQSSFANLCLGILSAIVSSVPLETIAKCLRSEEWRRTLVAHSSTAEIADILRQRFSWGRCHRGGHHHSHWHHGGAGPFTAHGPPFLKMFFWKMMEAVRGMGSTVAGATTQERASQDRPSPATASAATSTVAPETASAGTSTAAHASTSTGTSASTSRDMTATVVHHDQLQSQHSQLQPSGSSGSSVQSEGRTASPGLAGAGYVTVGSDGTLDASELGKDSQGAGDLAVTEDTPTRVEDIWYILQQNDSDGDSDALQMQLRRARQLREEESSVDEHASVQALDDADGSEDFDDVGSEFTASSDAGKASSVDTRAWPGTETGDPMEEQGEEGNEGESVRLLPGGSGSDVPAAGSASSTREEAEEPEGAEELQEPQEPQRHAPPLLTPPTSTAPQQRHADPEPAAPAVSVAASAVSASSSSPSASFPAFSIVVKQDINYAMAFQYFPPQTLFLKKWLLQSRSAVQLPGKCIMRRRNNSGVKSSVEVLIPPLLPHQQVVVSVQIESPQQPGGYRVVYDIMLPDRRTVIGEVSFAFRVVRSASGIMAERIGQVRAMGFLRVPTQDIEALLDKYSVQIDDMFISELCALEANGNR